MPTGLVLDEFDVDLPPLTSGLVVVVIVIVGGGTNARTLYASRVGAISVAGHVVVTAGGGIGISDVGHF